MIKVIIADDHKLVREAWNLLLSRDKRLSIIAICENGFQVVEACKTLSPDVVLMDINMPLMNGFETSRRIRRKGIETPIIALTAFDKNEITDEAIAAGINDIIIKPFEPVQLFKIINCLILKAKSVV